MAANAELHAMPKSTRTICFTGKMSMTRRELLGIAQAKGVACTNSVAKADYVVVGDQTANGIVGGKSKKLKEAEALRERGHAVRFLTEAEFLSMHVTGDMFAAGTG